MPPNRQRGGPAAALSVDQSSITRKGAEITSANTRLQYRARHGRGLAAVERNTVGWRRLGDLIAAVVRRFMLERSP